MANSGASVASEDCDTSQKYHLWDIERGSGSVILFNSQLALDAGENPSNGGSLKIWTSYRGLYQRRMYHDSY